MDIAILFQGQGKYKTQYVKKIIEENKINSLWKVAMDVLGWSPLEYIEKYEDIGTLTTDKMQPLIYLMDYSQFFHYQEYMPISYIMMGHSMGEITALTVSNKLSFEDGLNLIKIRGLLMQECSENTDQGMLALLDCGEEQAEEICMETRIKTGAHIWIANDNSLKQQVLAGTTEALNYVAKNYDVHFRSLSVKKAFHTEYMREAAEEFGKEIKKVKFHKSDISVVSNYTARPYQFNWSIPDILCKQIVSKVRWRESMDFLKCNGLVSYVSMNKMSPFRGMDKSVNDYIQWIYADDFNENTVIDFSKLYHTHEPKKDYGRELIADCLKLLISNPWKMDANETEINKAKMIYNQINKLYKQDIECDEDEFNNMIYMVAEGLKLKGVEEEIVISKLRNIMHTYGVEADYGREKNEIITSSTKNTNIAFEI